MKEASLSFCPFDSTWQSMVRLVRDNTTTQSAFSFLIKMKMQFLSSLLWLQLALVLLSLGMASVNCLHPSSSECCVHDAWRKCHMAVFFIVFCEFIIACFVVVLDVLVAGDLRHEYAQST
jgi:ABC-type long-subunit fatty acid transport system fused permease/ATPase subunit